MLNRIIELSLKNRVLVVALACALGAWGWWAAVATPVDAIPDLSDNQVIVFTEWSGHSAQEVEDQVTYPLTVNLQGLPGVRVVRSQSAFGFSMIYVIFEDAVDQYFARRRVDCRSRPPVPDRHRSEPAPGLQPVARRRRRVGPKEQSERRWQRARSQRHVVDRARRGTGRIGGRHRPDRRWG